MITTTLNRIRAHGPCQDGWSKLLKGLGKTAADDDPLPFARIAEINGLDGMTLRDWFAGQALPQSVEDYGEPASNGGVGQRRNRGEAVLPYSTKTVGTREEIIARQAYRYADAMLAAREAKP